MATSDPGADHRAETTEQVAAIMPALQALVGVAAQSVTEVEDRITLPQLRVLVLLSTRRAWNLNALAAAMDVHPSNASRAVERLVVAGLVRRTESSADRRNLVLEPTEEGARLIETLVEHRRAAIASVLERVPVERRGALVEAMRGFGDAAGEVSAGRAWKLGWHG